MKTTNEHAKIMEICFIIYFIFMFLFKQLGYSADDIQYRFALVFSIFFLLVKILFDGYTKREWFLFTIFFSLSILSATINGKIALLFTVLTVFSMKNVSITKLCKYLIGTELFVFGINIITYFVTGSQVDNTVRMNAEGIVESITRNSLGFVHANALHGWLVAVLSLIIYLNYRKFNSFIPYILMFVISLIFYSFGKSRSGLIVSFILLTMAYSLPYLKRYKLLRFSIILSPIIFSLSMISLIEVYDKHYPLVEKINILLMNRVMFASNFLYTYQVKLFGSNTVDSINGSIIDSGFAELYIRYGVVIFILLAVFNSIMCKKMLESEDYAALAIVLVFQVYNLTEPYGVNIFMNISYVFMYKYLIFTPSITERQSEEKKIGKEKTCIPDYGT